MSLSRESGSWLFVEKYEGHNILMQHLSVFLTLHHGKTYFYGNEIVNGTRRSLLGFFFVKRLLAILRDVYINVKKQ